MRNFIYFTVTFILGVLLSDLVAKKAIAEEVHPEVARIISNLELQKFQLENKRKISNNPELIDYQRLHIMEQLAAYNCLRKKGGVLGHWGAPEGERCNKYLKMIDTVSSTSAIKECIVYGQDSNECEVAFLSMQAIPRAEATRRLKVNLASGDLPMSFRRRTQTPQEAAVKKAIADLKKPSKDGSESKEAREEKMEKAYEKLVGIQCTNEMLILHRTSEELGTKFENFSKDSGDSDIRKLRGLLDTYQKKSADNRSQSRENDKNRGKDDEVKGPPLVRVHVLSDDCFKSIEELLKVSPLSAYAICSRDGGFSPNCRQAKSNQQKKTREKSNSFQSLGEGVAF